MLRRIGSDECGLNGVLGSDYVARALLGLCPWPPRSSAAPRPPPPHGARRPMTVSSRSPRMMAMRLISSETPCTQQQREGERDQQLRWIDGQTAGVGRLLVLQQGEPEEGPAQIDEHDAPSGAERTGARTRRSSRARALGSMLFTMSMRMCSFESSVHGEHSRNTAPNRIHWISSQELDEVLKTLRTMALAALTRTATRIAHATTARCRVLKLIDGAAEPEAVPSIIPPSSCGLSTLRPRRISPPDCLSV